MTPPTSLDIPAAPAESDLDLSRWSVLAELTKPRLTALVVATTGAGHLLRDPYFLRPLGLLGTLVGTALVAASASTLNMVWEQRWDRLMTRTQDRPLPAERIGKPLSLTFALVTLLGGLGILLAVANSLAAGLALASLLIYVFVYTPLKRRWTWNTLVGAVPGAIPPLIGWTAVSGQLEPGAWSLFGILFLWQVPHFLAIAWLHRDDYGRGGFRMLPAVDPTGRTTARMVIIYLMALIPISLAPVLFGVSGLIYGSVALLLNVLYLLAGIGFARERSTESARRLFRTSLLYLPLLLMFMVLNPTQIPNP